MQLAGGSVYWKYLNTDTEGRMSAEQWELERIGTLCFYPSDAAEIFSFIDKACAKLNDCVLSQEEKERITRIILLAKGHRDNGQ